MRNIAHFNYILKRWTQMSARVLAFAAALAMVVVPILVPTGAVHAQTSRGAVTGTVRDPAEAVIHGATIVLTNTQTGVRRSTPSNEAGVYQFDAVDPGDYELKVTHPGSKPYLATQ